MTRLGKVADRLVGLFAPHVEARAASCIRVYGCSCTSGEPGREGYRQCCTTSTGGRRCGPCYC